MGFLNEGLIVDMDLEWKSTRKEIVKDNKIGVKNEKIYSGKFYSKHLACRLSKRGTLTRYIDEVQGKN